MDDFLRRSMISSWLLGGCAAEVLQDEREHEESTSVEGGELPSPRVTEPVVSCAGTPVSTCDGPFTGVTCDLP
jgi:hypothetical protein